jgi:hypothetical protein
MPALPPAVRLRQRGDIFRRLVSRNPVGKAIGRRDQSADYARRSRQHAVADVGSIPTVSTFCRRRPRPGGAFVVHLSKTVDAAAVGADDLRMRPVRSTIVIMLAAAFAVGGCGAGDDSESVGSQSAVAAQDGQASANSVVEGAARELARVQSYHVSGRLEEDGKSMRLSGDLLPNGFGRLTVDMGDRRMELVLLEEGVYLKANAAFWIASTGAGVPKAVIQRLSGRWVEQDAPDGAITGILDVLGPRRLAACLQGGTGTLTLKGTATYNGQAVTVVADARDKPGTAPSRYYLRRQAPHLIVGMVATGPERPGPTGNRVCDGEEQDDQDEEGSVTSGELRFSRFDDVEVQAPRRSATVQEILREAGGSAA